MKDWTDITTKTPRRETRRGQSGSEAAACLPGFSRDILLMLYVGVMAVLGWPRHHLPGWREEGRRVRDHAAPSYRSYLAITPYRYGIEDWVCDPRPHWRLRVRARWLSSRDINNSPDPRIRRIGYDEWYTRRAYSRVPGMGLGRLRSRKNNPHPDRAAGRAAPSAAPQGEGVLLVPP